jgi:hypothetical protein
VEVQYGPRCGAVQCEYWTTRIVFIEHKPQELTLQLIVDHQDPWDAFQAISHFELLPFRDAGNGVNEYALSIQVCTSGSDI